MTLEFFILQLCLPLTDASIKSLIFQHSFLPGPPPPLNLSQKSCSPPFPPPQGTLKIAPSPSSSFCGSPH